MLLESVRGETAQALCSRLQTLRQRLAPPDASERAELAARLDAALAQAARLPVVGNARAWANRPNRNRGDRVSSAAMGVTLQLQAARFALESGDRRRFREALETAAIWLQTFFDQQRPETRTLAGDLKALRALAAEAAIAGLDTELAELSAVLAGAARAVRGGDAPSGEGDDAASGRQATPTGDDLRLPPPGLSSD